MAIQPRHERVYRRNIIHQRNMTHDYTPPEYSFLDSMGRRHIRLDVDIMTCNGTRYFTTFRYTAPVSFDFSQGWVTDCSGLPPAAIPWHTESRRAAIKIHILSVKQTPCHTTTLTSATITSAPKRSNARDTPFTYKAEGSTATSCTAA